MKIVPLTKNPNRVGRIGPEEKQDWFKGLVKAKNLFQKFPNSKIIIISNVFFLDGNNEADIYKNTLKRLGVKEEDIIVIRENFETLGQVETAKKITLEKKEELIVVSTWLHYLRVRYLFLKEKKVKHHVVFGIPRPREVFTDIVLTFLLPLIDLMGLRKSLKKRIEKRRRNGKF